MQLHTIGPYSSEERKKLKAIFVQSVQVREERVFFAFIGW